MDKFTLAGVAAIAAGSLFAGVYGDVPDAKHAWAVHDWNRPKPTKVEPAPYGSLAAPSDAIVLFDGTKESFEKNWCDAKGKPSQWKLGNEGDFYCVAGWKNGGVVRTREEFGDCQLHIEFRHDADITDGGHGPQMRGNSGVFLMGTSTGHEVQVLESYYTSKEMEGKDGFVDNYTDGQAGSVYAENPPMVNPQRKPGEWQVYDIVYHQEVWDGDTLVHPGSMTVFFNGVLVQDHWELEGLTTHCRRRPLAPIGKTKGPLALQDHGCVVHFRNIWIRPLPSRWDNTTHSSLSAKEGDVMALRRATAAKLYAKIEKPVLPTVKNMMAMAEVISYAKEGEYKETWKKLAEEFHGVLDKMTDAELTAQKRDLITLRNQLDTLIKGGVVSQSCGTRIRINAASLRLKWENL